MKELDASSLYWLEAAQADLKKAQVLASQNRKAAAQEFLRNALSASTNLPRWFTDTDFEEQYSKLYKQLYSGT